jgi:hypothetical protein
LRPGQGWRRRGGPCFVGGASDALGTRRRDAFVGIAIPDDACDLITSYGHTGLPFNRVNLPDPERKDSAGKKRQDARFEKTDTIDRTVRSMLSLIR